MMISTDDAKKIHYALVDFFREDGDPISPAGVKDEGLLSSALHRPMTSLGDTEKYKTEDEKAAALLHSLIKNHPFHNGNKRTALVICLVFYEKNHATLEASEDDFFNFILNIAKGNINCIDEKEYPDKFFHQVVKWLRSHKKTYSSAFGDIKIHDFLRNCKKMGAQINTRGGSFLISVNGRSVTISKSTRRFESAKAKRYLGKLGLNERNTGVTLEEFLTDTFKANSCFKEIVPLLRRLAYA